MTPRLVSVTIENFKSFKTRTDIPIGVGFNCIAGENGAGKSNLLDAISFSLGEQPAQLRVKTLSELAGIPNRKVEAEICFEPSPSSSGCSSSSSSAASSSSTSSRKSPNTRIGSVFVDGARYYLVNGSRTPKHRFEEVVAELGLHIGGQAVWRITQSEINRKVNLSASELYDAISVVSGTKLFNQRREEALKQLDTCRRTLTNVGEDLERLESEVEKDRTLVRDWERLDELRVDLSEEIPGRRNDLEGRLTRVDVLHHRERARSLHEALSETLTTEAKLQVEVDKLSVNNDAEGNGSPDEETEAKRSEFRKATTAVEDIKSRLSEAGSTREHCAAFRDTLPAIDRALNSLVNVERPALNARLVSFRAAALTAADRVEEAKRQQDKRSGGEDSSSVKELLALAFEDAMRESERSKIEFASTRSECADMKALVKTTEAERSRAEAKEAEANSRVSELSRQVASLWKAGSAGDEKDRDSATVNDCTSARLPSTAQVEKAIASKEKLEGRLRGKVTVVSKSCHSLAAELRCWVSLPSLTVAGKDSAVQPLPGTFLFERFRVKASDELRCHSKGNECVSAVAASELTTCGGEYSAALDVILSPSLSVRVVNSTNEGMAVSGTAQKAGKACRVWALDRIEKPTPGSLAKRRNALVRKIFQRHNDSLGAPTGKSKLDSGVKATSGLTDPAQLLCWDTEDAATNAAVNKALGNWVIADDDATAAAILKTNSKISLRVVTKAGNQHSVGRLVGGGGGGGGVKARKLDVASALRDELATFRALSTDLVSTEESLVSLRQCEAVVWDLHAVTKAQVSAKLRLDRSQTAEASARTAAAIASAKVAAATEDHSNAVANAEAAKTRAQRNANREKEGVSSGADLLDELRQACSDAQKKVDVAETAQVALEEREDSLLEALNLVPNDLEELLLIQLASTGSENQKASSKGCGSCGGGGGGSTGDGNENSVASASSSCPKATMAACDRVLKFLDLEQERLDSDLVKASLIKEAAKDAVAAATSAGDDQRRQQHEVQKALQRAKQACTEQGRKAKALESEAALHEKAAAKAEAKAGKLPAAAASAARYYDDAVENSEKALKSALHALAAEETALREELRGLKRKGIGRSSSVIVNRGTLTAKVNACETLRGQVSGVYDAMSLLEAGLKSAVGTMKAANRRCFAIVRQSFNNQIARLLPGKRGVLEPLTRPRSLMTSGTEKKGEIWKDGIDGDDENLEEGILMAIGSAANLKSRRSIAELSGGQKALVGLALTFALSSFRRLPLYVLDEIDAPLDEHNQGAAAEAVAEVLAGAQVLCVSHHTPFHRQADTIIQITRQNESSKLLRCVKQAGAGVKRSEPHGGAPTSKSDGEQRRR